ncbi:MAG: hypothetical protein ACOZAL_01095 [Patescibacteria group bacterium]
MGNLYNAGTIRTSAALAAAGAWDSSPTVFDCQGADQADFWISYDEHASASAGKVKIKIETATEVAGTKIWSNARYVVLTGTFTGGADVASQVQSETVEFDPTVATAEYIHLMVPDLNADFIRINVAESGDTTNPGTVVIYTRLKSLT